MLGQHLDDLAESFLMSALHNGQIRTMKANYLIDAGDIRVIRPLIYVRENQTRDFSVSANLPIINENCPACFEQPKERARIKKLLSQEEVIIPGLFYNLKRGLTPLMHSRTYEVMAEISKEVEVSGKHPLHLPKPKRDVDVSSVVKKHILGGSMSQSPIIEETQGNEDDMVPDSKRSKINAVKN